MKIWTTFSGIISEIKEAEVVEGPWGKETRYVEHLNDGRTQHFYYPHGEGRDWHRNRADAVKRSENIRADRIKALEDEIVRLRGLRFEK